MSHDDGARRAEDTKYEEAEEVGLEGLAPDKLGDQRDEKDRAPADETHTPHDDA